MPERPLGLQNLLRGVSPQGLSPEDAVKIGKCPLCGKAVNPNTDLRDGLSLVEYFQSGMCQEDQDKIFGGGQSG